MFLHFRICSFYPRLLAMGLPLATNNVRCIYRKSGREHNCYISTVSKTATHGNISMSQADKLHGGLTIDCLTYQQNCNKKFLKINISNDLSWHFSLLCQTTIGLQLILINHIVSPYGITREGQFWGASGPISRCGRGLEKSCTWSYNQMTVFTW